MSDPRIRVVEQGYDAIGETFVEWRDHIGGDPRRKWADELTTRLGESARVLELGCGSGIPDTQLLAERFQVTGVDVSDEQIKRARANVPSAQFIQCDFTSLRLEPASFEAVAAFYSFNHVPRDLLGALFSLIHDWLVPGGLCLVAMGTGDTNGWTGDWLGTSMFFSSFPPHTNRRLLDEAGFDRLLDEVVTLREPEGDASFQWVLAKA